MQDGKPLEPWPISTSAHGYWNNPASSQQKGNGLEVQKEAFIWRYGQCACFA